MKDTAMMAARARRGADLLRKEAELRAVREKQQIHLENHMRSKQAEAEAKASEMRMRGEHAHEVEVLRGAVARGRAASSHAGGPQYAPTIAYPARQRAESLAPTVAYPSHRSRSRHIPLPTNEEAEAMEDVGSVVSRKRHHKKK